MLGAGSSKGSRTQPLKKEGKGEMASHTWVGKKKNWTWPAMNWWWGGGRSKKSTGGSLVGKKRRAATTVECYLSNSIARKSPEREGGEQGPPINSVSLWKREGRKSEK